MSTPSVGGRPDGRPVAGSLLAARRSRSVRRALAVAGCGVITVTLAACESTEHESAKIGREEQQAAHALAAHEAAHVSHSAHSAHGHQHPSGKPTGSGG